MFCIHYINTLHYTCIIIKSRIKIGLPGHSSPTDSQNGTHLEVPVVQLEYEYETVLHQVCSPVWIMYIYMSWSCTVKDTEMNKPSIIYSTLGCVNCKICQIVWQIKISNEDIGRDTNALEIRQETRLHYLRWQWGCMHCPISISRTALGQTPQGERRKGRLTVTWRWMHNDGWAGGGGPVLMRSRDGSMKQCGGGDALWLCAPVGMRRIK